MKLSSPLLLFPAVFVTVVLYFIYPQLKENLYLMLSILVAEVVIIGLVIFRKKLDHKKSNHNSSAD